MADTNDIQQQDDDSDDKDDKDNDMTQIDKFHHEYKRDEANIDLDKEADKQVSAPLDDASAKKNTDPKQQAKGKV